MKLSDAIESYVTLKHSLGAVFSSEARILRFFERTLGEVSVDTISPEACHEFCRGTGLPTRWWERKHQTLHGFFTYLVTRGHLVTLPLLEPSSRIPRSFEPYVYSRDGVQRLLDATAILEDSRSLLQHLTFRTLLLLLYGVGLRPGEGLRLRCCGVDLDDRVLAIWDTNFFKSRLVTIGSDLITALAMYRKARQCLPMPTGPRSAFFASRTGNTILLSGLEKVFVRLREHVEIQRPPDAR